MILSQISLHGAVHTHHSSRTHTHTFICTYSDQSSPVSAIAPRVLFSISVREKMREILIAYLARTYLNFLTKMLVVSLALLSFNLHLPQTLL